LERLHIDEVLVAWLDMPGAACKGAATKQLSPAAGYDQAAYEASIQAGTYDQTAYPQAHQPLTVDAYHDGAGAAHHRDAGHQVAPGLFQQPQHHEDYVQAPAEVDALQHVQQHAYAAARSDAAVEAGDDNRQRVQ
jgi:hypothetical protein